MYVCTHTCIYIHTHIYTVAYLYPFLYLLFFFNFYLPARDYPWMLKNKRPDKLRDTLKEVEVCFRKFQVQQHIIRFADLFQQL